QSRDSITNAGPFVGEVCEKEYLLEDVGTQRRHFVQVSLDKRGVGAHGLQIGAASKAARRQFLKFAADHFGSSAPGLEDIHLRHVSPNGFWGVGKKRKKAKHAPRHARH